MTTVATAWIGEPDGVQAPQWARKPVVSPVPAPEPVTTRPSVNDSAVSSLVGKNLRRLRKQHRLSLEELARQSGVSRAMLGQVEQGKSMPSIKTLWQVAQALGVSVSWFLEPASTASVLLIAPPEDSPEQLRSGEGELRSLEHLGDGMRDGFYELRLGPNAVLSLPATMGVRRVNVVVSAGTLLVQVEDTPHFVQARQALQYEAADALVWRNVGTSEVQAFIVIRSLVKQS